MAILLTFLFGNNSLFAQKQAWNWYFGSQCGISFQNGEPVSIPSPNISTLEGCASISDTAGHLLFYTDGSTIWNKNHQTMSNGTGLKGNSSSTQSAVIVPHPVDLSIYYVFTVDACNDSLLDGLQYSIVDMKGSGTLGSVTEKNVMLQTNSTEKITAVWHRNKKSIWVIAHGYNNNQFSCYLITNKGLNAVPVISQTGSIHKGNNKINDYVCGTFGSARGYLKCSADGRKIATAQTRSNMVELFDFDNGTGKVSNPISFTNFDQPYGIEFSDESSKLYISTWDNMFGQCSLYQIDLSDNNRQTLLDNGLGLYSSLQIGPDKKIYYALQNAKYLNRIEFPAKAGRACTIKQNAVLLDPNGTMHIGLPTFIQSYFINNKISFSQTCLGQEIVFKTDSFITIRKVTWNFGDPTSVVQNLATGFLVKHTYLKPGDYTIKAIVNYLTYTDTLTEIISILPQQTNLKEKENYCEGTSVLLDPGDNFASYKWSDGSLSRYCPIKKSGVYKVEVSDLYGCSFFDSVMVNLYPKPTIDLGNDKYICEGGKAEFELTKKYQSVLWSDGTNKMTFSATSAGNIWVQVKDSNNCEAYDTINVKNYPKPVLKVPNDTAICQGEKAKIAVQGNGTTFEWSSGEKTAEIEKEATGIYHVTMTDTNKCRTTAEIRLLVHPLPVFSAIDTSVFHSVLLQVNSGTPPYQYSVNGGSFTSQAEYFQLKPGQYIFTVKDKNACTISSEPIIINEIKLNIPNFFTPNADGFNDYWEVKDLWRFSDAIIKIYDRFGRLIFAGDASNPRWDGRCNNSPVIEDDYWYFIDIPSLETQIKGHVTVKK
jgi:gliding motility-associated-like protein